MTTVSEALKAFRDSGAKYLDLRFTDVKGKWQHLTMDGTVVDEDLLNNGVFFDGSSIAGWKAINESDMVLRPENHIGLIYCFPSCNRGSIKKYTII